MTGDFSSRNDYRPQEKRGKRVQLPHQPFREVYGVESHSKFCLFCWLEPPLPTKAYGETEYGSRVEIRAPSGDHRSRIAHKKQDEGAHRYVIIAPKQGYAHSYQQDQSHRDLLCMICTSRDFHGVSYQTQVPASQSASAVIWLQPLLIRNSIYRVSP
ncbi:uncharacterized protein RAG0_16098 [Rhynchosporium agropyri]|uniref:Uncharacterized protein n=1 Tax=Rhynchosporium agropyri TaxID=914238 RepID=A0A1E1LNT7_9HELO|nr:uncharacterized protein RAG0_16098 [Rhynchosporium agropyri]